MPSRVQRADGQPPVLRFAPSPNGNLHLGHALSALLGFDMARQLGGRFLLRIEDIDTARCRENYITQMLQDLAWLGLTWETPVLRQSAHFADYRAAAKRLLDRGFLYRCWATRTEIATSAAHDPTTVDPDGTPHYPGLHKHLPAHEIARRLESGEPYALRIDMEKALAAVRQRVAGADLTFTEQDASGTCRTVTARPERWGDTVILRKDVPASYHLAVVVDDARQGVTLVTRGQDLFAATDLHRLLQVLLDLPEPRYCHHRLITDAGGRKLAKSARDTSLRGLREQGLTAIEVRERVGLG